MHPLLRHINNQVPFEAKDFDELFAHFQLLQLKKGNQLIGPNEVVRHQYFVLEGSLRTYLIDSQGKEHTIQFAVENWWVSDYQSYYKECPSVQHVECLEDCRLLKISKEYLLGTFDRLPNLERYFRKQLENAFVAFQVRILSSLQLTAEERYTEFIKAYPNIEQRVKNYQIASYLGITPESLSRVRKKRKS